MSYIENVLKCGTATFPTWRQRTLYDNNCIIIFYFVSGKVEQNESPVCFGCINQRRRRPATYSHHIILFGNFCLEMYKNNNNKKGKNVGFFQKGGGGGRALWLQVPVIIPSRLSKGDKSEKWYFSYILHFNLILNINIVGGSKMLWKNISANKPLILIWRAVFLLCKQKGIKIPDLLWLTRADDHDVFGCSTIPFCLQSQNSTS